MTQQILNLGISPNDKTGDKLPDACIKINSNFDELYERLYITDISQLQDSSNLIFQNDYSNLLNAPSFHSIAFTQQYADLVDQPTGIYLYTLSTYIHGKPLTEEKIFKYICTESISIPSNFISSVANSGRLATNNTQFSLRKNNVEFGQLLFNSASNTGTFSGPSTTFNVGDVLSLIAPTTIDPTLANIAISIIALRG